MPLGRAICASKVGKAFASKNVESTSSLSHKDNIAHKENSRNLRLKSWKLPLQMLFTCGRVFQLASLAMLSVYYSSRQSLWPTCWHVRAYSALYVADCCL